MINFESARDEFNALKNITYLNWAGTGPLPRSSKEAVSAMLDSLYEWSSGAPSRDVNEISSETKEQISTLINAENDEIAITGTNTSQGIQTALEAIGPKRGESVVTSDMQYVLTEAELQKWRDRGVEIRVVRNRNGVYDIEDFADSIDDTTRVVLLDSVTWINGYKFDVPEISKIAHENNAYMVTDSIQHLGQAYLDSKEFGADMIAGGAQKWLSDWLGLGFLYVKKSVMKDLQMPNYGYKNAKLPEGSWPSYFTRIDRELFPDFEFYEDARKFEYGGSLYNMPGLAALTSSLKLINGIGIKRVADKVLELKHALIEELESMKITVLPPFDEKFQSGITTFATSKGRDHDLRIVEKLNSSGFALSYRAGGGISGIRVSTHYVNNLEDIERFITALKEVQ